jgi:diguanylate cyclase (GGDEF)-like protein/PAS domain S-box-containing protein
LDETVRLSQLWRQFPQAVLLTDAQFRVEEANAAAETLLGLSADAWRKRALEQWIDSADWGRIERLAASSQEGPLRTVVHLATPGSPRPRLLELKLRRLGASQNPAWIVLMEDVGGTQEALDVLRKAEERYRRVVEACPDGVALLENGLITFANGAMERLLSLGGPDELWGCEFESFVHPDDVGVWQSLLADAALGAEPQERELRLVQPGGKIAELEFTGIKFSPVSSELLFLAKDIRRRKAVESLLRESEDRYKGLADIAFDGLAVHIDGIILNVNRSFESMFGREGAGLLGEDLFGLFTPDSASALRAGLDGGEVLELQGAAAEGRELFVEASTRACLFRGEPAYVTALRDVTRRRQTEEMVRRQAWYDVLTGLPNRILFLDRLEHALDQAKREGRRLCILFLDLDRFKMVNDSMGHAAGDQLLQAAAGRLQVLLRKSDTVARLGGDEFTVLLEDPVLVADATGVSQKIVDSLRAPFSINGQEVHIGASVGVAFYPDHAADSERLLKLADMAMYRAKENGRNQAAVYAEALESGQEHRLGLENDLRRAIERLEFELWFQPQVTLNDGIIRGSEALLRWNHPQKGFLRPDDFIPLAEESRLILPMGEWVLFEACRQAAEWRAAGFKDLRVAVNLSAWQLNKRSLIKTVDAALEKSGLPPNCLELEITETVAMADPARTLEMLTAFAERGLRLSLDDFGKGYSSLGYLKEFPVHTIKADRSFVSGLPNDGRSLAILKAMIALSHSLGLECLAEGIETREQWSLLKTEGADLGQGYLFSRPVPGERFRELLSRARPLGMDGG